MNDSAARAPIQFRARSQMIQRFWRQVHSGVLLAVLVGLVALPIFGSREVSFAEFDQGTAGGSITSVQVVGQPESPERVQWRSGLLSRHVTCWRLARYGAPAPRAFYREPAKYLRSHYPQVSIGSMTHDTAPGLIGRWAIPAWLWFLSLGCWLACLILLGAINNPWRFNNNGWLWLIAFGGLPGVLAFLLLAGPVPLIPQPYPQHRRLTGWHGFVIALALGGLNRLIF